jgi:hypothetical protein
MIDRIVLSCDDNPKFIQFWPLVTAAWRRFFGDVEVWLTVVSSRKDFFANFKEAHATPGCYVQVLKPVPDVPSANQAKMARYFTAASWNDSAVISTNDMDLLPLQRKYFCDLLVQRPPLHLMTIGSELYTGKERGKFTAGYLTAESSVWKTLVNPFNRSWMGFVRGFVGWQVHDHKEDISRVVHHEDPDTFSDESLLRALLTMNPVPVKHLPRGFDPYTDRAFCRSNWKLDRQKLEDGTVVEAHLPRPWDQYKEQIKPLADYIGYV